MRVFTHALAAAALSFCACASTPSPVQRAVVDKPIPAWPASVADTCPEREVSVECFRREGFPRTAIREGMTNLEEQLQGCIRRDSAQVRVKLTIETHGGSPSCVEASVWDKDLEAYQSVRWLHDGLLSAGETARCAATVVAGALVLPDSSPDEHCRWNFPIHF